MARSKKTNPEADVAAEETSAETTPGVQEPAHVELSTSEEVKLPEKPSEESIQAMVQEKLSRRGDEPGFNPFVPSQQLESEVKEVAKKSGFPLTRGTEIGARLIARSQRLNK